MKTSNLPVLTDTQEILLGLNVECVPWQVVAEWSAVAHLMHLELKHTRTALRRKQIDKQINRHVQWLIYTVELCEKRMVERAEKNVRPLLLDNRRT